MEFSIGSCIRFGWETFKKRPWFFVGVSLLVAFIYAAVSFITGIVDGALSGVSDDPTVAGFVVNWILGTLVGMGIIAFFIKAHDNPDTVEISELWHPRLFLKYFATTIFISLAVVLGFVLLIVPGVMLALMFMFATYIVIDREQSPIKAMKESKRITRGHKWQLLGFALVLAGINILGAIALLVGLLVSVPVSSLAMVHAYRILSAKAAQ